MPGSGSLEADYVICGGGGAGCVIATRLAEALPHKQILLLEQGVDSRDAKRLQKPLDSLFWLFDRNPYLKWLECEPQPELGGRAPRIPVGKVLGGGTSINTLMYNTGAKSDFDEWHQPGWSFKELEPLIRKTINYDVPEREGASPHGRSGKFQVSLGGHQVGWGDDFCMAVREIVPDMPAVDSLTTYRHGHAVGRQPKMITGDGKRSEVVEAYLTPCTAKNLRVVTGITIDKAVIKDGRAVGVEITTGHTIRARHEVIVCCGALGTPGVLERSGLGDPAVLDKAGIKVEVALPGVGREVDDHQLICSMYHAAEDLETFDDYARGIPEIKDRIDSQWEQTGKGICASNGYDWGYKIRPTKQEVKAMGQTFEAYWNRIGAHTPDKPLYSNVIIPFFYAHRQRPATGKYFCIGGFHNYPASRGSIHISSPDPLAPPILNAGLLTHPADMPVHIWHYKLQREIVRRLPFYRGEEAGSHPRFSPTSDARLRTPADFPERIRGRIKYTEEDDRAIDEWVRETVATAYHTISTCPMRSKEDGGVVDARLNVYGVQGLRVADLSICSSNIGTNTTSTVLIIAEKAAQLIVEDATQLRAKL